MDILHQVNVFLINCGISPSIANVIDQFIVFALGLAIAYLAAWSCRKVLIRISSRIAYKNNATWDGIVFDRNVLSHLSNVVPTIIIYLLVPIAFADTESVTLQFIQRLCLIYILIAFVSFLNLKVQYGTYDIHLADESEESRNQVTMAAFGTTYKVASKADVCSAALAYHIPIRKRFMDEICLYNDFSLLRKRIGGYSNSFQNVTGCSLAMGTCVCLYRLCHRA